MRFVEQRFPETYQQFEDEMEENHNSARNPTNFTITDGSTNLTNTETSDPACMEPPQSQSMLTGDQPISFIHLANNTVQSEDV